MATILITGGTGMIGSVLDRQLREAGHETRIVSRRRGDVKWDPSKGFLPQDAYDGVDHIIHLAGAGIADKRWTKARKGELISSRLNTTKMLTDALKNREHQVKSFICASAVGFYGSRADEVLTEESSAGKGFLADLSGKWEDAAMEASKAGVRTVRARIGIVLSMLGGALPEMTKTAPVYGLLGGGGVWLPVIHVEDMAAALRWFVETDSAEGAYNVCGPEPITQGDLMREVLKLPGKNGFTAPVPEFGLRLMLGEMADAVLQSTRTLPKRLEAEGFEWRFARTPEMLRDLYGIDQ
jgi:uncharacterized protein (TIGR01777 family)